jgi:hypothetical protein
MAPWWENWLGGGGGGGGEIPGEKRKTRPSAKLPKPKVQWTGWGPNPDFYRDTPSANGMKSICNLMKQNKIPVGDTEAVSRYHGAKV